MSASVSGSGTSEDPYVLNWVEYNPILSAEISPTHTLTTTPTYFDFMAGIPNTDNQGKGFITYDNTTQTITLTNTDGNYNAFGGQHYMVDVSIGNDGIDTTINSGPLSTGSSVSGTITAGSTITIVIEGAQAAFFTLTGLIAESSGSGGASGDPHVIPIVGEPFDFDYNADVVLMFKTDDIEVNASGYIKNAPSFSKFKWVNPASSIEQLELTRFVEIKTTTEHFYVDMTSIKKWYPVQVIDNTISIKTQLEKRHVVDYDLSKSTVELIGDNIIKINDISIVFSPHNNGIQVLPNVNLSTKNPSGVLYDGKIIRKKDF